MAERRIGGKLVEIAERWDPPFFHKYDIK